MDPISLTLGATAVEGALAGGGEVAAAGAAGGAAGGSSILGSVGMGAQAGGGILGAIGNLMSGNANSNMYKYQAGIAQMNKRIADQDANYARGVGEVDAQKSGMQTRFQLGKILTAQSGSGIDVNSGSSLATRESQQEIGSYDQAIIRSNAAKRAYGFEVQAATDTAQSQMYQSAAEGAKTAGEIGAGSSILGAASSVSNKWLQAKNVGLFT